MSNHKLFCIMGETASGKDTLTKRLCEDTGMNSIISYTTRPRRANEGDTHIFVDDAFYEQMKDNLAAYTEINGFRYWTTIEQIYNNEIVNVFLSMKETSEKLQMSHGAIGNYVRDGKMHGGYFLKQITYEEYLLIKNIVNSKHLKLFRQAVLKEKSEKTIIRNQIRKGHMYQF